MLISKPAVLLMMIIPLLVKTWRQIMQANQMKAATPTSATLLMTSNWTNLRRSHPTMGAVGKKTKPDLRP